MTQWTDHLPLNNEDLNSDPQIPNKQLDVACVCNPSTSTRRRRWRQKNSDAQGSAGPAYTVVSKKRPYHEQSGP